jgi:hypothetical protein
LSSGPSSQQASRDVNFAFRQHGPFVDQKDTNSSGTTSSPDDSSSNSLPKATDLDKWLDLSPSPIIIATHAWTIGDVELQDDIIQDLFFEYDENPHHLILRINQV